MIFTNEEWRAALIVASLLKRALVDVEGVRIGISRVILGGSPSVIRVAATAPDGRRIVARIG